MSGHWLGRAPLIWPAACRRVWWAATLWQPGGSPSSARRQCPSQGSRGRRQGRRRRWGCSGCTRRWRRSSPAVQGQRAQQAGGHGPRYALRCGLISCSQSLLPSAAAHVLRGRRGEQGGGTRCALAPAVERPRPEREGRLVRVGIREHEAKLQVGGNRRGAWEGSGVRQRVGRCWCHAPAVGKHAHQAAALRGAQAFGRKHNSASRRGTLHAILADSCRGSEGGGHAPGWREGSRHPAQPATDKNPTRPHLRRRRWRGG